MASKTDIQRILGNEDIRILPERVMSIVQGDISVRDEIYRELIKAHEGDLSFDWFQQLYEDEFAERKKKGQDFTSMEISDLLSKLAGEKEGFIHEPTAGCGGLLIKYWWNLCSKKMPWDYKPSSFIVSCWELSDRAVPFLLLNLSIRGIMGEVFHGDVLEKKAKARYVLLNEFDDSLSFSEIVRDDLKIGGVVYENV